MHEALERFLSARENRLARTAREALAAAAEAECVHIDRHVLSVSEARMVIGSVTVRREAISAAIELARRWNNRRRAVAVAVSTPVALVEDEWLAGDADAAPPHVYICVAARAAECKPVPYGIGDAVSVAAAASAGIRDDRIRRGEILVRCGKDADGHGSWYFLPGALEPVPDVGSLRDDVMPQLRLERA